MAHKISHQLLVFSQQPEIAAIMPPRTSPTLPTNYILRKYKDITRARPVTSYYRHVLKRIFRVAGSALTWILNHWAAKHYNLDKVSNCKEFLLKSTKWQHRMETLGFIVHQSQWDIKEMFTNIPQADIPLAVQHMMNTFHTKEVWCTEDGRTDLAAQQRTSEATVKVSFETLLKIIQFDCDNAYSTLGPTILLRQTIGIPIGGIMSSAVARTVVSVQENRLLEHVPMLQFLTIGGRYTDDLRLCTASYSAEGGKQLATQIVNRAYTGGLSVKYDEQPESYFVFVGIHGDANGLRPHNRNEHQILTGQDQKFIRYPRASCSRQPAQKLASLIGGLINAIDFASDSAKATEAVLLVAAEFLGLGYTPTHLRTALEKAKSTRPQMAHMLPHPKHLIHLATQIRLKD